MNWLTEHKIPLGKWVESFVDVLNEHAEWLFNAIAVALTFLIEGITDILQWIPPILLVAIFAAGAFWLRRSWKLVILMVLSLLLK